MTELKIPEVAKSDSDSFEVLRVWLANQQQHITLKHGVWEDPAAWGLFLCDLARHIANAYKQESGRSFEDSLSRIRAGFDAEMNSPTDFPRGSVVDN